MLLRSAEIQPSFLRFVTLLGRQGGRGWEYTTCSKTTNAATGKTHGEVQVSAFAVAQGKAPGTWIAGGRPPCCSVTLQGDAILNQQIQPSSRPFFTPTAILTLFQLRYGSSRRDRNSKPGGAGTKHATPVAAGHRSTPVAMAAGQGLPSCFHSTHYILYLLSYRIFLSFFLSSS